MNDSAGDELDLDTFLDVVDAHLQRNAGAVHLAGIVRAGNYWHYRDVEIGIEQAIEESPAGDLVVRIVAPPGQPPVGVWCNRSSAEATAEYIVNGLRRHATS
jgi:hypothetical protein